MQELSSQDLALLLQFITGTSSVPAGGFQVSPLKIVNHPGDAERLPTAHACFNQLDLPKYTAKWKLREKLLLAVRHGSEGFAFS